MCACVCVYLRACVRLTTDDSRRLAKPISHSFEQFAHKPNQKKKKTICIQIGHIHREFFFFVSRCVAVVRIFACVYATVTDFNSKMRSKMMVSLGEMRVICLFVCEHKILVNNLVVRVERDRTRARKINKTPRHIHTRLCSLSALCVAEMRPRLSLSRSLSFST